MKEDGTNEQCPSCDYRFKARVPYSMINDEAYWFSCDSCGRKFEVENLPRIVWKLEPLSSMYYTTLVHRYTEIDGYNLMRFEYFDEN